MVYLISNLVEKNYTPYTARMAPKHLTHKPQLGRLPQKMTALGRSELYRQSWLFIRKWVCHNHKFYYTYLIGNAIIISYVMQTSFIKYYQSRNYERSLPFAI